MRRRPPRSTRVRSSAASDVYKRQLLVQRRSDPSGGLRRLEELGVVGPAEGLGGPVVDLDELEDLVGEVLAGGDLAAAQHAAGQDREEDLDNVEPTGVFGRVGHGEARVIRQPCPRAVSYTHLRA